MKALQTTGEPGFSLVEVLVVMVMFAGAVLASAHLFGLARMGTEEARQIGSMTLMAQQKLEELRALTWSHGSGAGAVPLSDWSTDLSIASAGTGGNGLRVSPAGTLTTSTPGYVDYLDRHGTWVGTGAIPPADAVFIRRWSIQASSIDPSNTLVLHVRVVPVGGDRVDALSGRARIEARLATMKTRKAA